MNNGLQTMNMSLGFLAQRGIWMSSFFLCIFCFFSMNPYWGREVYIYLCNVYQYMSLDLWSLVKIYILCIFLGTFLPTFFFMMVPVYSISNSIICMMWFLFGLIRDDSHNMHTNGIKGSLLFIYSEMFFPYTIGRFSCQW